MEGSKTLMSAAGPSQGAKAPSGGREPRAAGSVGAFIFDMDGTMIDSMPWHAMSWGEFTRRHGLAMPVDEVLQRTTGRTGAECMRELFGHDLPESRAWELIREKEDIYRALYAPEFSEVGGFRAFAARAMARGLKVGVGTAGDRDNIAFAFGHLRMDPLPHAVVGGDEGLRGKPEPDIFLEAARRLDVPAADCIVFEDAPFGIEAARRAGMRAVAVCTTHTPQQLGGPHVVASVRNYHELLDNDFLEAFHVA